MKELGLNQTGDLYEFGVFQAESMFILRKFFPSVRMWGFDSFEGLPETQDDVKQADWGKGAYRSSWTIKDLIKKLGGPSKTDFVKGFYDKSLTSTLAAERKMAPAFYIDMDADLYISSIQALDWMFSIGLARKDTLVGYDDWWVNPCTKGGESLNPLETSVGKAHQEVARKYRVKFRCVAGPCTFTSCNKKHCCWGPIFIIEALGGDTEPDHGFRMTDEEVKTWKQKNLQCKATHGKYGFGLSKS